MIELKISLELTKNGIQKSVHAKEGESESRKLIITLTESGKIYNVKNMSARVYYEDGTYSDAEIPESGNVVEFVLPSGLVSAEGVRICELQIRKGTACIYSPMFELIIEKSFGATATEDIFVGETEQYQPLISTKSDIKDEEMCEIDCFAVFDAVKSKVVLFPWLKFWEQHCKDNTHTIDMVSGLRKALDSLVNKINDSENNLLNDIELFGDEVDEIRKIVDAWLVTSGHEHGNKNVLDSFKINSAGNLEFGYYGIPYSHQIPNAMDSNDIHNSFANSQVVSNLKLGYFNEACFKILFENLYLRFATKEQALPSVTTEDNGKFLMVSDGAWAAVAVPSAEEAVF